MRPSKFTSSLCTGEGGVFGGMYLYHSMFDLCHGQCAIWLKFGFRRNLPLTRHLRHTGAAVALAAKGAAGPTGGEVVAVVLGRDRFWEIALLLLLRFCLVNCFARLLAALAWLAALVPFPVWVLRLNRIPRLLSVWFIASRGHHFALGTGGLKLSLLVGGLGPVYSLPKHCFKPFRRNEPFGIPLKKYIHGGWNLECSFPGFPEQKVPDPKPKTSLNEAPCLARVLQLRGPTPCSSGFRTGDPFQGLVS